MAEETLQEKMARVRARFADELRSNPQLREKLLAISAGENLNPQANQAVLESAMNRAAMMGTPLSLEARTTGERGYYAGYNPRALSNPNTRAMIEDNLAKVLSGSNVSNFSTDNSSEGNNHFASRRFASGMYKPTFSAGGEFFSYPSNSTARGYGRYGAWLDSLGVKPPEGMIAAPATAPISSQSSSMLANAMATPPSAMAATPPTQVAPDPKNTLQSKLSALAQAFMDHDKEQVRPRGTIPMGPQGQLLRPVTFQKMPQPEELS